MDVSRIVFEILTFSVPKSTALVEALSVCCYDQLLCYWMSLPNAMILWQKRA